MYGHMPELHDPTNDNDEGKEIHNDPLQEGSSLEDNSWFNAI